MKDPYQQEQTPYEVLSVDPDASPREIHNALGDYLKARKNPQLGMRSAALLRSIQERLEIDLFFYSSGIKGDNSSLFQVTSELDDTLPIPVENERVTDLDLFDIDEIPVIEFNQCNFIEVNIPLEPEDGWLPREFDR